MTWQPAVGDMVKLRTHWSRDEKSPPVMAVITLVDPVEVEFIGREQISTLLPPYVVSMRWFQDNYEPDDFMDAMGRIES